MIGNKLARLTGSKRNLLALLASSAVFTAGCNNMATTAPDANPFSSAATLSGNIHGGSQPVVNATVTLWYAGQKGSAGFAVTKGATTTTDANGNFSFVKDPVNGNVDTGNMYSCPLPAVVASPLVYVIATGGNTAGNVSGPSNSGAAFIGVYGSCTTLSASNQLFLNEVTTVATMAVMQQFFDPVSEGITADGTLQEYNVLNNVPNTINLLVNTATGSVNTSTVLNAPATGGHFISRQVQVTATPESTKINLLANILSTCINQATVAGCSPLFAAAVPPNSSHTANFNVDSTFPAATDTLQAIYYLLTNPSNGGTAGLATTFALAPGAGAPYQPALATQPTDWTIGINYASTGGTCGTSSAGAGGFIDTPSDIAIDFANNVWIANSKAGTGNLSELSFAGVPTTCVLLGTGGLQGVTIDSANIATGGNIWVGSANNSLYRFTPGNNTSSAYPVGVTPLAVGADGIGNVYFTSAATTSLYQLPGAATTTGVAPLQISNTVGPNPIRIMPDYSGTRAAASNIFVSSGAAFVSKVSAGTGGLNGFVTVSIPTSGSNTYGLSLGPDNNLFVSDLTTGTITGLQGLGGAYTTAVGGFPFTAATAGIAAPTSISIDGRENVWIPNNTNGTDTSSNPAGSVSYIGNDGTPLSPATGFQKAATYLNSGRALAVDQAGNVWIAGDGNNFITEIVGGGVPLFQPYAAGLVNGRFQTIP